MDAVITVASPWKSAMSGRFSTKSRNLWVEKMKCEIWPMLGSPTSWRKKPTGRWPTPISRSWRTRSFRAGSSPPPSRNKRPLWCCTWAGPRVPGGYSDREICLWDTSTQSTPPNCPTGTWRSICT